MSEVNTPGERVLWYFADPMCSWCWGFTPVVHAIKENYGEQFSIALMLGGLRPYTTGPMDSSLRADILHHWQQVHERTGQVFTFDNAMPEGFVYDTEPASRAVVTAGALKPGNNLRFFAYIQAAFYVDQKDVTNTEVLASLANEIGIDEDRFVSQFRSDAMRQQTQHHFQRTRQAGVRGFPTLLLQNIDRFELLTAGYRPYTELVPEIERWLAADQSVPITK